MRILLIDDVFTTGATVGACARILRRAGARQVDVLTLARTVRQEG
jgi:predicted amidophosphoribosyltransferase